jgi:hypothetical protein
LAQIEQWHSTAASGEFGDQAAWLRRHGIVLTSVIMVGASLWWKAELLSHFYFRQSDYQILSRAATSRLTWGFLTTPTSLHLGPAALGYAWLLTKAAPYDWTLASVVTVVLLGCADLALLRLLRTLFGDRPAILAPLAIYLVSPLVLPELSWWSLSLSWLPLQVVGFLAVDANIRYVRTDRVRHAAAAAAWAGAGMLFSYLGVLIPVLSFAITSAFLSYGTWVSAAMRILRGHWKIWSIYGVVVAAYAALFATRLTGGAGTAGRPATASSALSFTSTLVRAGIIPAAFGGPFRWKSTGSYALAAQVPVATQLCWLAAVAVVLATIWFRRQAWRAWAILAASILVCAVVPAIAWRAFAIDSVAGSDLGNAAAILGVLVICIGLACIPVAGQQAENAQRVSSRPLIAVLAMNLMAVFLVGSIWSAHSYETSTHDEAVRSYLQTAALALKMAPRGAEVVSVPVPSAVMDPAEFGRASYTLSVLGPLAPRSRHVRWILSPSGPLADLMIFDGEGRLWPAIVVGASVPPAHGKRGCWPVTSRLARIGLSSALYGWGWTGQLSYSGPPAMLAVGFGGVTHDVSVPAGHHEIYFPAPGRGSAVTVQGLGTPAGGCLTGLTIGTPQASVYGQPRPAQPVRG